MTRVALHSRTARKQHMHTRFSNKHRPNFPNVLQACSAAGGSDASRHGLCDVSAWIRSRNAMHDIGAALSGAISYCLDTKVGRPTTLKLCYGDFAFPIAMGGAHSGLSLAVRVRCRHCRPTTQHSTPPYIHSMGVWVMKIWFHMLLLRTVQVCDQVCMHAPCQCCKDYIWSGAC